MTPSADLRAEVLERLALLGTHRAWSASHVARCGSVRSTGAVWRVLRDLADEEIVTCIDVDEGRFRLREAAAPAELAHDQLTIGES